MLLKVSAIERKVASIVLNPSPKQNAKPPSAVNTTWPSPATTATFPTSRTLAKLNSSPTTKSSSAMPASEMRASASVTLISSVTGPSTSPASRYATIAGIFTTRANSANNAAVTIRMPRLRRRVSSIMAPRGDAPAPTRTAGGPRPPLGIHLLVPQP